MTVITKASLAAELGITKARVSQYVESGLPVRSDGKLDRETALNWITQKVSPETLADKGGNRARRLVRSNGRKPSKAPPTPPGFDVLARLSNPADAAACFMAMSIAHRLGRITASLAVAAGAPLKVAYCLHDAVTIATMQEIAEIGRAAGLEPWALNSDPDIWEPDAFEPVNWDALAARAGETLDAAVCEAYARERLGYLD